MLFNAFLNYLRPLIDAKVINLTEESKLSEVFNQLRIAYNQGVKGIEYCLRLFIPNPEDEDELFEYIYFNPELMRVVKWTNRNITVNLSTCSYKTLGVHLRIICSMLTKLKESGKIREDVYFKLHSSLTKNALEIQYLISTEGLPFQPR